MGPVIGARSVLTLLACSVLQEGAAVIQQPPVSHGRDTGRSALLDALDAPTVLEREREPAGRKKRPETLNFEEVAETGKTVEAGSEDIEEAQDLRESSTPDEWERAQLGGWRQEKPRCSEREWDEVIQVVVESLPERPQPLRESPALPEGEYLFMPRKKRPKLPEPQRESTASPECPALPPEKDNPVLQLPAESSAPQLLSERECPAPPKRKCPTLPVRARRAATTERLHSDTSKRVPCATRETAPRRQSPRERAPCRQSHRERTPRRQKPSEGA
ncbi:UNVERIFIED_CONTAM: hypothetical protein FKN15_000907 [Acipenser sinensis]